MVPPFTVTINRSHLVILIENLFKFIINIYTYDFIITQSKN